MHACICKRALKDEPPFGENYRLREWRRKLQQINRKLNSFSEYVEMLTEMLDLKEGSFVLDVGCGLGFYPLELSNLGAKCVGLDIIMGNCRIISATSKHFGLRMYAVHGDGCVLPFKDDYFDAAFSTNFFEHVRNRDLALDEQIRVLKKGGRLLVIDGNPLCPADMFMQLIWKPIKTKGKYGGFRWFFNKSKVYNGYHCEGRSGKDEDAHNIWWWQRKLSDYDNLDALEVTTTKAYQNRGSMLSTFLEPFYGSVAILAIKRF